MLLADTHGSFFTCCTLKICPSFLSHHVMCKHMKDLFCYTLAGRVFFSQRNDGIGLCDSVQTHRGPGRKIFPRATFTFQIDAVILKVQFKTGYVRCASETITA